MPTITDAIRAQFIVDTTPIDRGMRKATASVRLGTRNMSSRFNVLRGSVLGVVGAMGGLIVAKQVAGFFFDVNRNAQRLQASLRTVTGSAELASAAFAGIEKFAQETPFQVEEITDAFIKLTALGLKPSERALRSYGNTASAMGKSLNQFIEAVADASTMEFERLREFGIKARQQADTVSFTFQGVTTTVGKNAEEINEFLTSIGENNFADAMQEQTETMDGVISNILDNVSSIARTLGEEGGINAMITDLLMAMRDFTGALAANKEAIRLWGQAIVNSLGAAGQLLNVLKDAFDVAINLMGPGGIGFKAAAKEFEELKQSVAGVAENSNAAVEATRAAVEATRNWNVETSGLVISLDQVAQKLEKEVKPAIPVPEAIEFNLQMEGTHQTLSKVESVAARTSESIASMVGSLIAGEKSAANIGKSLLRIGLGIGGGLGLPGAGIASAFFGGLFKRGSAGRIQNGPVPMARSGMEIGNIGSRTKMIGVHSNEGVANAAFMDSFERKFGRGAFALANATGQAPGGDTFNFHFAPGTGASDQASIEKMVVQAISSAKRKLRL